MRFCLGRISWLGLILTVGWLVTSQSSTRAAVATEPATPHIRAVEPRGSTTVIRASVPAGVVRVVLEGCARGDLKGWLPRAVQRTDGKATEVTFEIKQDSRMELYRVRADASDPLPSAFYTGKTNYPGEMMSGDPASKNVALPPSVDIANGAEGGNPGVRTVVESDIWATRGDTLYYFNQYRGLQVLDIANPDQPALKATFPLPGAGEQMYVLDERHVALLAHDTCNPWGTEAESAVIIVDAGVLPVVQKARLPVKGRVVESRLVGTALYVATETWQPTGDASGSWQSGTWVASFDLAAPSAPVARKPLWFPGSGNVVTATDRFLFVAVTDYSRNWPWRSDLRVVDITSPDGVMADFAKIPLAGHVADKFKIDVLDGVLRVVVESMETASNSRVVTVLETIRLSDPRAMAPVAYARLGKLELARGDRLFGTRFDGNRAYIVTFFRVDPLFVVDLSDPAVPRVAGHLEIPGWSTYLRPLGGDRLLTLGIDNTKGWRVAVQLFDVADPAKPALLAKVPLGEDSSWSEATSDEKAFGVDEAAGLLMLPVTDWSGGTGTSSTGVQLIDLGRDTLTKRGLLASGDVTPRRAAVFKERMLAVSARRFVTADIRDRDQPKVSASVELSYPVERLLVAPHHLLEFQSGKLRVRALDEDSSPLNEVDLGSTPLLGATLDGNRLVVLQGVGATLVSEVVAGQSDPVLRTNSGSFLVTVWDASALPALTRRGQTKAPTAREWLPEMNPLWLRGDLLVWSSTAGGYYPWMWMRAPGGIATDAIMPVGGRWGWWFGWGGNSRTLLAVSVPAEGDPSVLSETTLSSESSGGSEGEAQASGLLVFSGRQRYESMITATNLVVEKQWFVTGTTLVTNIIKGSDGSTKTDVVSTPEGEWRVVTNAYPILNWWTRHDLDVVDFSSDPTSPLVRRPVPIGGPVSGVSHGGAMVYTTSMRTDDKGNQSQWLEAGAYDGVAVQRVDAIPLANYASNETAQVVFRGPDGFVARGSWTGNVASTLERWRISDTGRWERSAVVRLSATPTEIARLGDVVAVSGSGQLDLFGIDGASPLVPLPVVHEPGCLGGQLIKAAGNSASGVWLPLWDYGVIRLGP